MFNAEGLFPQIAWVYGKMRMRQTDLLQVGTEVFSKRSVCRSACTRWNMFWSMQARKDMYLIREWFEHVHVQIS
jgi:hypothetical protein